MVTPGRVRHLFRQIDGPAELDQKIPQCELTDEGMIYVRVGTSDVQTDSIDEGGPFALKARRCLAQIVARDDQQNPRARLLPFHSENRSHPHARRLRFAIHEGIRTGSDVQDVKYQWMPSVAGVTASLGP
ncbi:MAG TPA: hypothetical protein VFR96_16275 [Povalibacter sp.]|nr:hypothetical protein [Povalibacter sp.]